MQNKNSFFIIFSGIILSITNISAANIPLEGKKTQSHSEYMSYEMDGYNLLLPYDKGLTEDNYKKKAQELLTYVPRTRTWSVGEKQFSRKHNAEVMALKKLKIRFGCLKCNNSFARPDEVKRHVEKSKKHGASPSYFCSYCKGSYMRPDMFKTHTSKCFLKKIKTCKKGFEDRKSTAASSSADKDLREPGAAAFNDVVVNEEGDRILKESLGESGLVPFGYLAGDDQAFLYRLLGRD